MSNDDIDAQHTTSDILQPSLADGTPIIWDGNDAHIEGTLFDVGKYYLRVGLFQPLFKHRAVALANGKLAVEHPNAVYFLTGAAASEHGFENPCPPTTERYAKAAQRALAAGTPAASIPQDLVTVPAAKPNVYHAEHAVDAENSRLLRSLTFAFGQAEISPDLIDDAMGKHMPHHKVRWLMTQR